MKECAVEKQMLLQKAAKLVALGYDVEHKRSIVKHLAERGIEPSMELFRAIDAFNNAKAAFEQMENEYLTIKEQ